MEANQQVQINVTRWAQEEVNVLDLLANRTKEIRFFEEGEHDIYCDNFGREEGVLMRIATLNGLSEADVDLFDSDRRMFWELHIDKVDESMIHCISNINNPNWSIE